MVTRWGVWGVVFTLGVGLGCLVGRSWGAAELGLLLTMPSGGMHLSAWHQAVFQKTGAQTISWLRVPDPWQAQIVQLFGAGGPAGGGASPAASASSAPSTTLPPSTSLGPKEDRKP